MSTFFNDLKYTTRQLFKHPLITCIAVVTLALGMAGNTVIFSFVNGFFLRPMPFYEPDRLLDIDQTAPRWNVEYTGNLYGDFHAWREQNQSFTGLTVWTTDGFNLRHGEVVERITGTRVTHDVFGVLGVTPAWGRAYTQAEDHPGGERVVVLTHGLCQRLFGDQDVIGQVVQLNREPYTIIGVLAANHVDLFESELWVPLAENPEIRGHYYLRGVARLKPGVTPAMAQQDLDRIHQGLIEAKLANENTSPRLTPLTERYFGDVKPVLAILMSAVAVVLLIACGNVAALMLARGLARGRELGIRLSLGATPAHIVRMISTESLLLSSLAGGLSLWLSHWGLRALLGFIAERPPQFIAFNFDSRIWIFACLMVLLAAAFAAIPTCLAVLRGHGRASLNMSGQHATAAPKKRRSLHLLVVAEVALTLVLLVQTCLLIQAFRHLQKQDPGFRSDRVLTYVIGLPESQYPTGGARLAFFQDHLEQIRALPGVIQASAADKIPLGGHTGNFWEIENAPAREPDEQDPVVLQRVAFPGYFEAMGIQCLAGRSFNEQDGLNEGSLAVMVNQTFARRFWPNDDPVGKRVRRRGGQDPWMTVVGLTRDTKHYGLETPMIPGVFVPYVQVMPEHMTLVVHTESDPLALVSPIRQIVRRSDPNLPIYGIQTMEDKLHTSLWLRRLYSGLISIFAAVALVMAMGGLYGVFSYVTNGRVRELGVRIAIGAQPNAVLWLVLKQALRLTVIGIVAGLVGAALAATLMRSLLLGIHITDMMAFIAVPAALAATALLACWSPARRAARVNPMEALRCE
ncbi:MAG: ABC transporter permease [Phycisphaerae bacterium]|nr:ABC transporter permease [Phycisphaerae bacterium]